MDVRFVKIVDGARADNMSKKKDINDVRDSFLKRGCILLSSTYINYHSLLEYVCVCGEANKISYSNFLAGKLCRKCGIIKQAKSQKLDKEFVFSEIENHGYSVISSEYEGAKYKLNIKCSIGHNVSASYRSLKQNMFSCKKCSIVNMTGDKSPRYKHGRSAQDRDDRNKSRVLHNNWKRLLLVKFNFTCDNCKIKLKGNELAAHHLNGYHWDICNRYNINNGVILCKKCHNTFHSLYGKGDNTVNQYREFFEKNNTPII